MTEFCHRMAHMFNMVRTLRDRFHLRVNEDETQFLMHIDGKWTKMGNGIFASGSSVLRGSEQGKKLTFSSHANTKQRLLLLCFPTQRVIGYVEVLENGSLTVHSGPTFTFSMIDRLPKFWTHRVSAIVAVTRRTCTINITDILGDDEDILRLKVDRPLLVPNHYRTATTAYDDRDTELPVDDCTLYN